MDFQYLLNIVLRRKWLVFLACLIPAIATFVFFSLQDRSYKSDALISTRLAGTGYIPGEDRGYMQEMLVNIQFGTSLEKMKGPSMKRLLAYQMLLHDLSGEKQPFRTIGEDDEIEASPTEIQALLTIIEPRLDTLNTRVLPEQHERVFKEVSKALEYDFKTFDDDIITYRRGNTDNIAAEYASEDPYLSAYLINQLVEIFVRLNRFEQEKEYIDEYRFNKKIADDRRATLDSAKIALNLYKRNRTVIDLEAQSQETIKSINSLEEQVNEASATVKTATEAIAQLNEDLARLNANKTDLKENIIFDHNEVIRLQKQKKNLVDQFTATGNVTFQNQANLVQTQLDKYMERDVERESTLEGDYIKDLTEEWEKLRQSWNIQKIEAENNLASAQAELNKLNQRKAGLVIDQDKVGRYESALAIAEEEYDDAKNRLNIAKTKLEKSYQPLKIREYAQVADKPESSGRVMFTLFSGVLGGAFSVAILLLLAFFDMSLNNPYQFQKFTDMKLIGTINQVKGMGLDLDGIFSSNGKYPDRSAFKESIRSIRYNMEQSGGGTFLFTSTQRDAGKTFIMITLAYAMTLKKKKVLLIDTNFKNNTLTQLSEKAPKKNLLTSKLIGENDLSDNFESKAGIANETIVDHVDIIGNKGGYNSPGEIFAGKDFGQFIEDLKQNYDYVFMEGSAMNNYADTKELIEFSDKIIAVFGAETLVDDVDRQSIEFLKTLDDKLMGAILNKLDLAELG